jgi:multisubunit Na+/H+ antiporter MnhG subunit
MAGLFLLGLALGWEFDSTFVISIFIAYIFIFVLNWVIMYLIGKSRVRRMNMDLNLWKSAREADRNRKYRD